MGGDQIKPPWVGEADKEARERSGGKGEGGGVHDAGRRGPRSLGWAHACVRACFGLPNRPAARRRPGNVITYHASSQYTKRKACMFTLFPFIGAFLLPS